MRWSMTLTPPHLLAAAGASATLSLGPNDEGHRAELTFTHDEAAGVLRLELTAHAPGRGARTLPGHPEWYLRDHAVFFFNPGHDHAMRWMYAVTDENNVVAQAQFVLPGEEASDTLAHKLPDPPAAEGRFERDGAEGYRIALTLPLKDLQGGAPAGTPVGFLTKVCLHEPHIIKPLEWPAAEPWSKDTPLNFGDLYLSAPPLRVERVALDKPAWTPFENTLQVKAVRAADAPQGGTVTFQVRLPGDTDPPPVEHRWAADGDTLDVRLPLALSSRAKWANGVQLVARLEVAFNDAHGVPLWTAAYPFGFDSGIIVRERYGPSAGVDRVRPSADDPAFVDRYRAWVLSRLPDFRARATRDGGPSDFFLEDPAGEASLDLAAHDAFDRVADLLVARFPDWQDALFAAAAWACHPLVTRHSKSWTGVTGASTPETITRLGGCFCSDVARVVASLAERLGPRLNVDLKAHALGLRGHVCTLVDTPIGQVVADGMLGLAFQALDNTRLATLEELRSDARVAERMWYAPRAHGHEFFYGVTNQRIERWNRGSLQYPPSSPV